MWRRGEGFLILHPISSSFNYFFYFVYEVWTLTKQFFRTGSTMGNGPIWKFNYFWYLCFHMGQFPIAIQLQDNLIIKKTQMLAIRLDFHGQIFLSTSTLKASSSLWFTKNTQKTLSHTTNFVCYTDFQLWPWLMKGWIVLSFT